MNVPISELIARRSQVVARVTGILTNPSAEWPLIEQESATTGSLFASYIVPLSAIPAICGFAGLALFGASFFGVTYRPSLFSAFITSVTQYLLSLVGIYIMALIINLLAPMFRGQRNQVQALKLVAYSSTAIWLAGAVSLLPGSPFFFEILVGLIIAFYSVYLFLKGLPILMKSPKERNWGYAGCSMVLGILASFLISPIYAAVNAISHPAASLGGTVSGTLKLGGLELDIDQMQKSTANMRQAVERMRSGDYTPTGIPVDVLKQFLPASLPGGLPQRKITSGGAQIGGSGEIDVQALYVLTPKQVTLSVSDLGTASLASMVGALGIKGTRQEGSSYTRIDHANGRTIAEGYDTQARHGAYSVLLASRFRVQAEGSSVTIDDLKDAVNAVDLTKLDAMAGQK
jgi:hypothetical protein